MLMSITTLPMPPPLILVPPRSDPPTPPNSSHGPEGKLGTGGEQPLLRRQMRGPFEARRAREAEVGAERIAHRVDEALRPSRCEAVLPPQVENLDAAGLPVDPRLDPPDEAVAEEHRKYVPAPTAFLRWDEELPDVVEAEQGREERAIPHEGVERR